MLNCKQLRTWSLSLDFTITVTVRCLAKAQKQSKPIQERPERARSIATDANEQNGRKRKERYSNGLNTACAKRTNEHLQLMQFKFKAKKQRNKQYLQHKMRSIDYLDSKSDTVGGNTQAQKLSS